MLMHVVGMAISFVITIAQNKFFMLRLLPPELSCSRSLEDPTLAIKVDPAYIATRSTKSYIAGAFPRLKLSIRVTKVKGALTE